MCRSDVYILRSGDFRADRRRQTKPIALPLAHARGVTNAWLRDTGGDSPDPDAYMYMQEQVMIVYNVPSIITTHKGFM